MYSAALALAGQDEIANKRSNVSFAATACPRRAASDAAALVRSDRSAKWPSKASFAGPPAPQPPLTVTGPF